MVISQLLTMMVVECLLWPRNVSEIALSCIAVGLRVVASFFYGLLTDSVEELSLRNRKNCHTIRIRFGKPHQAMRIVTMVARS